jgi:hypothetical protein
MKRTLLFLAAASVVLSLPATAAAFRGVAVAKDAVRHSVVVASKGGLVRTVRAPGRAGSVRLGHRLVFSARRLPDGTFRATSLRARGNARHAVIRGVVVRNQKRLHRLLISAGGTVFAVRAPARGFSSNRGPRSGDRVEVRVTISGNSLVANSLDEIGHTNDVELEGIFLGIADGKLRLAVAHRGEVFVTIPAGFQLPTLNPGDEIELEVSVDTAGAFTLVSVQGDEEDGDNNDDDHHHGKVEVKGEITTLETGSITVTPNHGSPVTCMVPAGTDLSGFGLHDQVEMKCALVGTQLTLSRLKSEDDDDDDDDDGGHGGDH